MWPELPKGQAEIDKVRQDVISNPMVYGSYVSYDQKSALITVDFIVVSVVFYKKKRRIIKIKKF